MSDPVRQESLSLVRPGAGVGEACRPSLEVILLHVRRQNIYLPFPVVVGMLEKSDQANHPLLVFTTNTSLLSSSEPPVFCSRHLLAIMMFKGLIAGMLPALLLSGLALAGPISDGDGATKHRSKCRSNKGHHGKNSTVGAGSGYGNHSATSRAFWKGGFSIDTDYEQTMPEGKVRKVCDRQWDSAVWSSLTEGSTISTSPTSPASVPTACSSG